MTSVCLKLFFRSVGHYEKVETLIWKCIVEEDKEHLTLGGCIVNDYEHYGKRLGIRHLHCMTMTRCRYGEF